jgi:hypothetical protein
MCKDYEEEAIAYLPVSSRVTNLLFTIDELGLNESEMSDLSAGIFNRMDARTRRGGSNR